jgi:small-conductance mechanosensitive channel
MKKKPHHSIWIALTLISVLLLAALTACQSIVATEAPPTETSEPDVTGTPSDENTPDEEQIIITPTLAPTSTPGPLDEVVAEIAQATGLNRQKVFGLTGEDWINLLISIVIILLGTTLIANLGYRLILRLARATPGEYDDLILESVGKQVRWIIMVAIIQFSTNRLLFLDPEFKHTMNQVYFALYVVLITVIFWKLIDLGIEIYEEQWQDQSRGQIAFLSLLRRVGRVALIILAATMILNNVGVNVTGLIALLGVGGLAFSLAAQDTLADAINGFIILMDQPFREGDRIQIQGLDTWGDVVEIGTRTTRIRTRDNRMVIVPNSTIGKSQIVNYTYPDPRYRVQIEIGVEYGIDLDHVRALITDAVCDVQGVLQEMPVDVLFLEFGDPALILRIRWWIDSYEDTRRMFDRVNEAIYKALNAAEVDMPPTMYDVRVLRDPCSEIE